MIVDTHVHVVGADRRRYPLQPSGVGNLWYLEHPVGVADYLHLMRVHGVGAAVLVQPSGAYGYDNHYVLDAARSAPDRLCSVVIVDATADGADQVLRRLVTERGASGVRLFAIGPPGAAQPTWLDDSITFPVWEVAAELDVRVIVTALSPQLPRLARVLERFADVPVVLDHCGFPDLSGGTPFRMAGDLFDLAKFPNLHLKVTSHVLESTGDPADVVERLAAVFGADRLLWGSDYPQTHDHPYGALVELGRSACSRLGQGAQDAFLGGNALRLWPALAGAAHPGGRV